MKIVVVMKQVPNKDAVLRVRGDGKWVEEGDLSFEVNESDGYALEEALRLKEKKGGEVVVACLGPQRAKSVIKDALARGADRAIHVVADDFGQAGPYAASRPTSSSRGSSRTTTATGRRASSSPSFWACRMPPSSSRSTTRASSC